MNSLLVAFVKVKHLSSANVITRQENMIHTVRYAMLSRTVVLLLLLCPLISSRPHIIVIIADDMGFNDVGFRGMNQFSTPNIDALAYKGVVLDRHYSMHSCTPSRAALLTGLYPIRFGYQGTPITAGENRTVPHQLKTLPSELKKLGYKTHLVGKWHLGAAYRNATALGYGYDSFYGYWNGYIGYFDHATARHFGTSGIDLHDNLDPVLNETGSYATDLFTKRALRIIDEHPPATPLHLVISHLAPHTGKYLGPNKTTLEVHDVNTTNLKYSHIKDPVRRMYAEAVERLDGAVGEVVQRLSNRGLLDNSLVLFLSDNGAPTVGVHENRGSNFPFRDMKSSVFEGAVRVPAVLWSSLLQKSMVYGGLFHISDWVPTLYEAAGGNPSTFDQVDSVSHWKQLLGQRGIPRSELLVELDERQHRSAFIGHSGRFKLVNVTEGTVAKYYGEHGRNGSYNITKVIASATCKALSCPDDYHMLEVRRNLTMADCRSEESVMPCKGRCLYDLWEDPCERKDVSDEHVDVVEELWKKIEAFEVFPQQKKVPDPASDPSNCGGVWFTWLEEENACIKMR